MGDDPMGDDPMMLALDIEPMGGSDWRWRWYDHDSGVTLADGVEGGEVAAWGAALTHYVERSDECVRALAERAEAAEAAAAAAQSERAEAVAAAGAAAAVAQVASAEVERLRALGPDTEARVVAEARAVAAESLKPTVDAWRAEVERVRAEGEAAGLARALAAVEARAAAREAQVDAAASAGGEADAVRLKAGELRAVAEDIRRAGGGAPPAVTP